MVPSGKHTKKLWKITNHHFQWVNPLLDYKWSIFNSYVTNYQRVERCSTRVGLYMTRFRKNCGPMDSGPMRAGILHGSAGYFFFNLESSTSLASVIEYAYCGNPKQIPDRFNLPVIFRIRILITTLFLQLNSRVATYPHYISLQFH
jgi:hypothetical protein